MTTATPSPVVGAAPAKAPAPAWRRLLPLAALAAAVVAAFALDLDRFLSFDSLREHRAMLTDFVADNLALAALAYVAAYALAVALSIPGGLVLTVTGGVLFGAVTGTALVVTGATLGATALFLIARTALGEPLRRRASGNQGFRRMAEGFRGNALSYLLVLRLVPLFPFWLVNLVPASLGVPLRTYVVGTLLGIIPGAYVYASVGAGLGGVFDRGGEPSLAGVLTPEVVAALVGSPCSRSCPWLTSGSRPGTPGPPPRGPERPGRRKPGWSTAGASRLRGAGRCDLKDGRSRTAGLGGPAPASVSQRRRRHRTRSDHRR